MSKTAARVATRKHPPPRRGVIRRFVGFFWRRWRAMSWKGRLLVLAAAAILLPTLSGVFVYATATIPDPSALTRSQSSIVEDRSGREIGRFHAAEDRVEIPLEKVPMTMRRAVLAAEDKDFYSHRGLSPLGILRAAVTNLLHRRLEEGGSTITQQYVKNAFVGSSRTPWRKIKEAAIAIKLERTRSKDEILEAYLNTIYFGRGAYGVEAASLTYFNHHASALTLAESALLAAIIRAPESLDPARNADAATGRRNRIIERMAALGWAPRAAADAALKQPAKVSKRGAAASGKALYFLEDVRRALVKEFGATAVYRGGLRIRTTLDLDMQTAAEAAVRGILDRPKTDPEAALVSIDPASGAVRAMVGGRDFSASEFNLASQARRQPGSTFKPFVLAAAINDGMTPLQKFRAPATITLDTGFQPWKVSNYDLNDYGTIDVIEATKFSVNTVYAQVILEIGARRVRDVAKAAGIASKISAVPSLALGTSDVTPLELTSAFATFAARGVSSKTHLVSRIVAPGGREIFRAKPQPFEAIGQDVADGVNEILQQVVTGGTGRRASLGRPVAGKTGTTESHRDAWFAGYLPNLATVVWMGYPDGTRTMENVRGIAVTGSSFPARIWRAYMEKAVEKVPVRSFAEPLPFETPSPTPTATPSPSATIPLPTATGKPSASPSPSPTGGSSSPKPSKSPSPAPSPTVSSSPGPGP